MLFAVSLRRSFWRPWSVVARVGARSEYDRTSPYDGRKAGAGAARSLAEDGAATASSSPRSVIRGESPPGDRLVRDG
jgi:hypothetical protein